jgi:Mg-chelatase subunit ChlD
MVESANWFGYQFAFSLWFPKWFWGSIENNLTTKKEDDMSVQTFRTESPSTYISPSREEMKKMAERVELKSYAPAFAADLANLAAGGEIAKPSSFRGEVESRVRQKLGPKADRDDVSRKIEREMKYHQRVSDFLREVDLDQYAGSPLERAMECLKVLSGKQGGEPGSGEASDDPSLPIFQEESGDSVAHDVNEAVDTADSLTEEEQELLDQDDDQDGSGSDGGKLGKRSLAPDMLGDKGVWINISRRLDKVAKMKVAKSSKLRPDPEGNEVRVRQMKDISELPRIQKTAWALRQTAPTQFWYKAVTNQHAVRERVVREDKKQLLYVLIDCSGSMDSDDRIQKAGGVLFNRLKAVVEGEAEIFVSFFDSRLKEQHEAADPAEAKKLMSKFGDENFSGGGTNISGCVREAHSRIEELVVERNLTRPEIVVVTDGDDSITIGKDDIPATKVHAFVVGGSNSRLLELARETGGVGIDNL